MHNAARRGSQLGGERAGWVSATLLRTVTPPGPTRVTPRGCHALMPFAPASRCLPPPPPPPPAPLRQKTDPTPRPLHRPAPPRPLPAPALAVAERRSPPGTHLPERPEVKAEVHVASCLSRADRLGRLKLALQPAESETVTQRTWMLAGGVGTWAGDGHTLLPSRAAILSVPGSTRVLGSTRERDHDAGGLCAAGLSRPGPRRAARPCVRRWQSVRTAPGCCCGAAARGDRDMSL